jgi:hypothetical protein
MERLPHQPSWNPQQRILRSEIELSKLSIGHIASSEKYEKIQLAHWFMVVCIQPVVQLISLKVFIEMDFEMFVLFQHVESFF